MLKNHAFCILLFLKAVTGTINVIGVRNLSKVVRKQDFWMSSAKNYSAINNLNFNFSESISSFVGPSGSGKSTLAKIISGREGVSSGSVLTRDSNSLSCSYLDALFNMRYDANKSVKDVFSNFKFDVLGKNKESDLDEVLNEIILILTEIVKIPQNEIIRRLLESERKKFEILLGFFMILVAYKTNLVKSSNSVLDLGSGNNINTPKRNIDLSLRPVIIFDEYFDKETYQIRKSIKYILDALCSHPLIQLQVIIITHSYGVMKDMSDDVIVLNNGRLYGNSKTINIFSSKSKLFPSQHRFIESL